MGKNTSMLYKGNRNGRISAIPAANRRISSNSDHLNKDDETLRAESTIWMTLDEKSLLIQNWKVL